MTEEEKEWYKGLKVNSCDYIDFCAHCETSFEDGYNAALDDIMHWCFHDIDCTPTAMDLADYLGRLKEKK